MLRQKGPDFLPAVDGLLGAIRRRTVVIEKSVACAIVAVELVVLARLLELFLVAVHLLGRRSFIVVAEKAEHGTGKVLREIDRRNRLLGRQLFFRSSDAAAPAFDECVDAFEFAGGEKSVTAAGACSENADFAVPVGLRADKLQRAFEIAEHLVVRHTAGGANFGADVL